LTNSQSTISFRYESIFDGSPVSHTLPKWRTGRLAFAGRSDVTRVISPESDRKALIRARNIP
jgi:hypothetical protein